MSGDMPHPTPSWVSPHASPFVLDEVGSIVQLGFHLAPYTNSHPSSKTGYQICKKRRRSRLEIENIPVLVISVVWPWNDALSASVSLNQANIRFQSWV